MKRLFLILYSIFFIVGCEAHWPNPYENHVIFSECPDTKALNYNYLDCNPYDDPSECPWETNEDCIYCEDEYDTEEERFENCCNIPDAENYSGYFGDNNNNWSVDSTYCIFD